jgi:hypothetical protein
MSAPHVTVAEIAEVLASPSDDARRRHLIECVRCRLLVSRYEAFVAAPTHVSARERAEAEQWLARFLDDAIGGANAPLSVVRTPVLNRGFKLFGAAWRPAFAAVAIAVLGAGALWFAGERAQQEYARPRVLRGGAAGPRLELAAPVRLGHDGLELRWNRVAGADRYELRFFTPELDDRGAPIVTADTSFTLATDRLPGTAAGDTLLCRVSALLGEAKLAESMARPLILPGGDGR